MDGWFQEWPTVNLAIHCERCPGRHFLPNILAKIFAPKMAAIKLGSIVASPPLMANHADLLIEILQSNLREKEAIIARLEEDLRTTVQELNRIQAAAVPAPHPVVERGEDETEEAFWIRLTTHLIYHDTNPNKMSGMAYPESFNSQLKDLAKVTANGMRVEALNGNLSPRNLINSVCHYEPAQQAPACIKSLITSHIRRGFWVDEWPAVLHDFRAKLRNVITVRRRAGGQAEDGAPPDPEGFVGDL